MHVGVERLYVHVDANNDPAVALYQKLGFEVMQLFVHVFKRSIMDLVQFFIKCMIRQFPRLVTFFQVVENPLLIKSPYDLLRLQM